ncbi:AMP-binding protein, partial [Peribacillus psychrosaccharolyticus]|uniref:AMP-binding protein n=1 Tax=Peribacillus psychrosaccharolyticus TaxID=1407 RepID=UPI003D2A9625
EEVGFILDDARPKVVLFEEALAPVVASVEKRFPETAFWYIDEDVPEYAASYQEKTDAAPSFYPQEEITADDLYAIMYTSGTTGRPKGVMHLHKDMVSQSRILIEAFKYSEEDIGLITAPMFHCAELHCAFLPRVQKGAK